MFEIPLAPRAECYECWKPRALCVCARIPRVLARTRLYVLQHPRERFHPIGTARFVRLGIAGSRVELARGLARRDEPAPDRAPRLPFALGPRAALLYPRPDARLLSDLAAHERPEELVVIDGTWHQARTLYRAFPDLHALPHVALAPAAPSRYRIRREPHPTYVSTLEAIAQALAELEPDLVGLDALLDAFDSMIDDQIGFIGTREGAPRWIAHRRPQRLLPRALVEDFEHLVLVYAESCRGPDGARRMTQLVALHAATGARLQLFGHASPPPERELRHAGLAPDTLAQGLAPEELGRAFASWLPEGAVLGAWTDGTLDLVHRYLPAKPASLCLKSVYKRLRPDTRGTLEDALLRDGLSAPSLGLAGRADLRLSGAVELVRWLRGLNDG